MSTVHVSGHVDLTPREFEIHYLHALEAAVAEGATFVVGDARGADAMALAWLAERRAMVTVFHMFDAPRYGAGLPCRGGFTTDEERDTAMTAASDRDIAWVRPGRGRSGTANNLLRRRLPPVEVARVGPEDWRRFRSLRLTALADAPDAFCTRAADEADRDEAFWRERASRAGITQLVAHAGRDVGLAVVSLEGEAVGVHSVWVDPTARGHGVGDALMATVREVGERAGKSRMLLDVTDASPHAVALYARHGWRETGRRSTLPPPREAMGMHERELLLRE